jgi:hypothetical protein
MNKRSKLRNKERNKYAKLINLINETKGGIDPIDIPNCSGSLAKDVIDFSGTVRANHVEDCVLFKKQRIMRGFDDTELWNLDYTMAKYILPRLIEFRKVMNGYPATIETFEEYAEIVDKMIYAFDHIVNTNEYDKKLEKEFDIDFSKCQYHRPIKQPDGSYRLEPTENYDSEKFTKYHEAQKEINDKIDEGLSLFGKYFRALWW